jgi:hypothetical protein
MFLIVFAPLGTDLISSFTNTPIPLPYEAIRNDNKALTILEPAVEILAC